MFLALDTATEHAGVALINKSGNVIYEKNWLSNRNHTSELHLAIQSAHVESAIGINDLKGSFPNIINLKFPWTKFEPVGIPLHSFQMLIYMIYITFNKSKVISIISFFW